MPNFYEQVEGLTDKKEEAIKGFNKEFDPSSNAMRYGHYVLPKEVKPQIEYYNVLTLMKS